MYVICYDISSDKIRKKTADTLLEYGKRIQYSVFECDLNKKEFRQLYKKLCELSTKIEEGSIRIYWLCSNCMEKAYTIGTVKEADKYKREDIIVI